MLDIVLTVMAVLAVGAIAGAYLVLVVSDVRTTIRRTSGHRRTAQPGRTRTA